MNTVTTQNQKGFTLVEIAIVLVIIGLLLGGVLKGQELITNAKIKAVSSDFDNISAAYYAYQDRTGTIPGDSATTDGVIDTDDAFWFDLKTEGFISGLAGTLADSDGPAHDLSGVWTAVSGTGTGKLFTTNYICASNIPDNYASGIDKKLDDGVPNTGSIRSATVAAPTTVLTAYAGDETLNILCKSL
ncbi:MAG: prepilin-type N-terminal cleavage/methylation domain-containing protein [Thiomicrorhabdus sp.]|nr:prepilin-type N-terminal cleavage/methylation domain-containing protein [Thiomicrorhabdus sp.]